LHADPATGAITYTPNVNFTHESFTYEVTDDQGHTSPPDRTATGAS